MPEAPEYWVTSYFWVPWFRRAGFLSDKHHTQPTEPLKVYRGVCPAHCGRIRRMSWTADLRTAVWFAYRWERLKPALYEATIPPEGVLARWYARGEPVGERIGSEPEVVIDPEYLQCIRRVKESPLLAELRARNAADLEVKNKIAREAAAEVRRHFEQVEKVDLLRHYFELRVGAGANAD
jgi:hypothetical protein